MEKKVLSKHECNKNYFARLKCLLGNISNDGFFSLVFKGLSDAWAIWGQSVTSAIPSSHEVVRRAFDKLLVLHQGLQQRWGRWCAWPSIGVRSCLARPSWAGVPHVPWVSGGRGRGLGSTPAGGPGRTRACPGPRGSPAGCPLCNTGVPQLLGGSLGFSLHSCAVALPKGFLLFCLVLLDFPDVGPGQWQAGAPGGALPLCRGVRSSGSPCPCPARANQKPHPLMGRTGHGKAFAVFNIPYRNVHLILLTCVFPLADEAGVTGAAEGLPSQRFKTSGGRAAGWA